MMEVHTVILLLAAVSLVTAGKHDVYSRSSVHGVVLRDQSDQKLLHDLEVTLNLDVWQHGMPGQRDAQVMVSSDKVAYFLQSLDEVGLQQYLHLSDVAKSLEEFDEKLKTYQRNRAGKLLPFENYPRYDEILDYLEHIAATYPEIATLVTPGNSFEGRPIKYLKISTTNFNDPSKPIYFMDAMIHSREWVTAPTALYAIHRLVEPRDEDRDLLEGTDWIILPIVNPDGYEFTHTDYRLWRRTRSVNLTTSETCVGVDGNRNFDVFFNQFGVSSDPCSDVYPGHEPFSEVETSYVRDILFEHLNRIQVYMNIHSYGSYVLYPFSNLTMPDNSVSLHLVGAALGAAIDSAKLPEGWFYIVGNSAKVLYAAAGAADDYALHVGVPFSYCLELPDYGFDFRVPPEYINHINEETWLGFATSARFAKIFYTSRYNAHN